MSKFGLWLYLLPAVRCSKKKPWPRPGLSVLGRLRSAGSGDPSVEGVKLRPYERGPQE